MKVIPFTIPIDANNSIHVQEDKLPHFYPHFHRHREAQAMYILEGSGMLITNAAMIRYDAGDVFFIGANQPHLFKSDSKYFENRKGIQIHSISLFFNPEGFINQLLDFKEMKKIKKLMEQVSLGIKLDPLYSKEVRELFVKLKNSNSGYRIAFFIELLQGTASSARKTYLSKEIFALGLTDNDGLRMNDVYQYSMQHFTENISLEEIAAVANLSITSFCRYFKQHTAKTYIGFLNEIRVNEAIKLLMIKKHDSVATVAYQSGFNNVFTFNRTFKNYTNKSPSQFLNALL